MKTYFDKTTLLKAILNIYQFAQSTNTGEALEKCLDIYTEINGMRPSADGVTKLVLVLTDGLSNGLIQPSISAQKLKSNGISIFSVGVGSGVNYDELDGIASDKNVFLLTNYNATLAAIEDIKQNSCLEPAVIPPKTNKIAVNKDSYKYFVYPLRSLQNKIFYLLVESVAGSVKVFYSFDVKNPNDLVNSVDVDSSKKKRDASSVQQFSLLQLNSTNLYFGIKGLDDVNSFKIEISSSVTTLTTSKAVILLVSVIISSIFKNL